MTLPRLAALTRARDDLSTDSSRSRERWRRIALAALGSGLFRVVSILGTIVTVPLIVGYSGSGGYGLLAVVTTLATLLAFSDLGIGSGLVTELAKSRGSSDGTDAQSLISSAAFILVCVALALGVVVALIIPLVPWAAVLGAPPANAPDATPSMVVFAVCFLLGIPAGLAQRVHLGLQEGLQASLWSLVGAVLAIVTTLIAVSQHASVPWLVAAAVGSTTLAGVANCVALFWRRPELRPRVLAVNSAVIRRLARTGLLFFVLVTASALAYQTDAVVISVLLGTSAVSEYSLPLRLFSLPLLAMTFILTPLWPAYSEAISRGDTSWVRKTLERSIKLSLAIAIPVCAVLVAFGDAILHVWVGDAVQPPQSLWWALGAWVVLNAVTQPLAVLCNGASVVRMQVVAAVAMTVINLGLSLALTSRIGVTGPVIGSLVAATLCSLAPYAWSVRRLLRGFSVGR